MPWGIFFQCRIFLPCKIFPPSKSVCRNIFFPDITHSTHTKVKWSAPKVTLLVLWSIFKTDLSYLLSLVFDSLSLVLSTYCFPVLIFCFYLYLNLCFARECTYCHIRNVIRLALLRTAATDKYQRTKVSSNTTNTTTC